MTDQRTSRLPSPAGLAEILSTLAPAFGLGLLLTPGAYWSRLRQGRSLLSPTLYERQRSLPRASLDGRPLSREPYLRPTPHTDCHAPEVVALADELRGRTGSDWQYVQAAYDFVRNEIASAFEPVPRRGVVGTLEAGFGVCLDKLNLFVGLARAGGIPARYCAAGNAVRTEVFPARPAFRWVYEGLESETDWRLRRIGAGLRRRTREGKEARWDFFVWKWHPFAELLIGGFWIPADPSMGDGDAAALGLPLPRFGYDPMILRGMTGSLLRRQEALPFGRSYGAMRRLVCLLVRGAVDYVNRRLEERRALGRQILADVGEAEYIRRTRRFYVPVPGLVALAIPPLL